MMSVAKAYSRRLHARANAAGHHNFIAMQKEFLPWVGLFLAFVASDYVFPLTGNLRTWVAVSVIAICVLGIAYVGAVFMREGMAAARREPPRYSE